MENFIFCAVLPVQKQTGECNYDTFAIAFVAEILDGKLLIEACFDVERMRGHLINCLEIKIYHTILESLIPSKCIRSSH